MAFWRDVNAPDTSWRPGHEDPIPVLLGRYPFTAFLYRWFSGRPLDGHARTNASWHERPTEFYTKNKTPPWPRFWHAMPRKRQVIYSRYPAGAWVASWGAVAWIGGWHALAVYGLFYWNWIMVPFGKAFWWVVTLWL